MAVKQIRVFPNVPLLQLDGFVQPLEELGWTAQDSDRESITFTQAFDSEDDFDRVLKRLTEDTRIERIEHGTVAPG